MKLKFWGVRGSIPCPGPATVRYGGNTSCLEVQGGPDVLVLDAGTGIRELGLTLAAQRRPLRVHLLISHTHWDHIQGFPFFAPIYSPGNEIVVYGPRGLDRPLEEIVLGQMEYSYFPVRGVELQARVRFEELDEQTLQIGPWTVATLPMNHPVRVLAYRLTLGGRTMVYSGDNEPYYDVLGTSDPEGQTAVRRRSEWVRECNEKVVRFVQGAHVLVADAQYTDEEYETKRGWGHSPLSHVLDLAARAGVERLVLFHHEPTHSDDDMDRIDALARSRARGFEVITAREGLILDI